jgi:hypothetical protein
MPFFNLNTDTRRHPATTATQGRGVRPFHRIESIIISSILLLFIIISFNIYHDRIVAYLYNNELHYSDEFMSGGEDFVPFTVSSIVFLPITILSIINIFIKKKIYLFFVITIGIQLYLFHIWLDSGNIWLNLLYGTMKLRIWIVLFFIIICYTVVNIIVNIIRYIKNWFLH